MRSRMICFSLENMARMTEAARAHGEALVIHFSLAAAFVFALLMWLTGVRT